MKKNYFILLLALSLYCFCKKEQVSFFSFMYESSKFKLLRGAASYSFLAKQESAHQESIKIDQSQRSKLSKIDLLNENFSTLMIPISKPEKIDLSAWRQQKPLSSNKQPARMSDLCFPKHFN